MTRNIAFNGLLIGLIFGLFIFILWYVIYGALASFIRPRDKKKRAWLEYPLPRMLGALLIIVLPYLTLNDPAITVIPSAGIWALIFYRTTRNIGGFWRDFWSGGGGGRSSSGGSSFRSGSSGGSSFGGFSGGSFGGGGGGSRW
ncbi:MAG: hypothetical protein Q7S89_02680 [bacterium]|nr:hypothetical protein [bacterium]